MNTYKLLKQAHTTLLIVFIYLFLETEGMQIPYRLIKWAVNLIWTFLLPIIFLIAVIEAVKRGISSQNANDAVENANKRAAIFRELSEFEWRNETTVYFRVIETARKLAQMKNSDVVVIPKLHQVMVELLLGSGHHCQMRQETIDEFISRNMQDYIFMHGGVVSDQNKHQINNAYIQQFNLIIKNGKGDLFKEFYLGRSLMFLKINKGNSREKPKHNNLVPEGV